MKNRAYIGLSDGSLFIGESCGAEGEVAGRVSVFRGMCGYQQVMTNPAHDGDVMIMTYPLIGNYGVNSQDNESAGACAGGLIVRELCDNPSNFRMQSGLREYLEQRGIVAVRGVDVRALAKHVKNNNVTAAVISTEADFDIKRCDFNIRKQSVPNSSKHVYGASKPRHSVAVLDLGVTRSFIRGLNAMGCDVTVYPANVDLDALTGGAHSGVIIAGGIVDMRLFNELAVGIRRVIKDGRVAVLGINAGHLLMAHAEGCGIRELSLNSIRDEPVFFRDAGRAYIVTVDCAGLVDTSSADITHTYVNGGMIAGLRYNARSCSVAFEPDTVNSDVSDTALADFINALEDKQYA